MRQRLLNYGEQLVQVKKEPEVEEAKIIARFKNEGLNNAVIAFAFDVSTGDEAYS